MKNILKKVALVLSFALVFAAMPMSVFAAANVSDETSLRNAITGGETEIIIDSGFELTQVIEITGNVTIKANSPVTLTSSKTDVLQVTGTLTLGENITIDSTASILWVKNGGTANVAGATLISDSSADNNCLAYVAPGGTINVSGGNVKGTGGFTTIYLDGVANITGGTVEATQCSAIMVNDGATANVDGGTVKCDGATAEGGFVAIFTTGNGVVNVKSGAVTSEKGAALDANAGGTVNVTNGTITGATAAVTKEDAGTVSVAGGTFSSDVSEYLAPGLAQSNGAVVPCDHSMATGWAVTTPATCTAAGTETATCTCGTVVTRATALAAHPFGGWYTVKEPSCWDAGYEARVCTACSYAESSPLAATSHNYDVNGVCAGCGLTKDGVATVVAEATGTSAPSRANPNTGVHF